MRGKAEATLLLEEVILEIVTVRGIAYALFVRERRQCSTRTFRIMKGFGSFTRVKEAAEYASDCRGATPERVPILHP